MIRAWSPTVPHLWSAEAVVALDLGAKGVVLRGIARGPHRLYATDFHNGHVLVFDERWRPVVRRGAFVDPKIPAWYSPFGISVAQAHVFVTYASPAPVDGNDAPTGGYVDEFDLDRTARRPRRADGRAERAVGACARAPTGSGCSSRTSAAVASMPTLATGEPGRSRASCAATTASRSRSRASGGSRSGTAALAGPKSTLFFAAGPHRWRGASEIDVHGLLGSIAQ